MSSSGSPHEAPKSIRVRPLAAGLKGAALAAEHVPFPTPNSDPDCLGQLGARQPSLALARALLENFAPTARQKGAPPARPTTMANQTGAAFC